MGVISESEPICIRERLLWFHLDRFILIGLLWPIKMKRPKYNIPHTGRIATNHFVFYNLYILIRKHVPILFGYTTGLDVW